MAAHLLHHSHKAAINSTLLSHGCDCSGVLPMKQRLLMCDNFLDTQVTPANLLL